MTDPSSPLSTLLERLSTFRRALKNRSRFSDIPARLSTFVLNHMSEYTPGGDRNILYLQAAGKVIHEYIGFNPFDDEKVDAYLKSRPAVGGDLLSYVTPIRIILIAENLLMLRKSQGFGEMCRRLSGKRDLRSAYFEIRSMRSFVEDGFEIDMWEETGVKTNDFDFLATKGGVRVAVETTAMDERPYSDTAIFNSLHQKRSQLPDDLPGIVFCLMPSQWEGEGIDLDSLAEAAAAKFLETTERVGVAVLSIERHVDGPTPGTGSVFLVNKPVASRRPRVQMDMSFLYRDGSSAANAVQNPTAEEFSRAAAGRRVGEFYEWVDYLRPE
jgi:hypothetical protein